MKRKFLAAAGALILLASCQQKEKLYLYNWTYFIPDETIFRFEKEFNVRVILDTYDGNDTMYAKLKAGNAAFDIAVPSGDYVSIMAKQGMLAELDKSLLPNFAEINPEILSYIDFDPGNRYSVPYALGATGININTNYVPEYEESWSIFSREDLKNRMTLMNDTRDVLGGALRYLGYSANSVNRNEIQAAKEQVLRWKPNLLKFDAESFGKDFAAKNTWIAQGFPEVVLKELESEADRAAYRFAAPKEGGLLYLDNMVILNNAPHKELAHTFINYILRPETHAFIMDEFYYPTILPAADPLRQVQAPYSIADLFAKNYEFRKDIGEANSLYVEAWNEILQGY